MSTIESLELRKYGKYTVEFLEIEWPFEIEEGKLKVVVTSGMPDSKELLMVRSARAPHIVENLDIVIRKLLLEKHPAFENVQIGERENLKAGWRLIDVEHEFPELVEYMEEQNPIGQPYVAQILWPDVEGNLPGTGGYSQFFNPQPVLKLSEEASIAARIWNSDV